jgi:hypothetical protein
MFHYGFCGIELRVLTWQKGSSFVHKNNVKKLRRNSFLVWTKLQHFLGNRPEMKINLGYNLFTSFYYFIWNYVCYLTMLLTAEGFQP